MINYQTASAPLDLMFQAMADPARRRMVERLSHGPASVSQLAKPLSLSLPGAMQHLAVLEASGFVRSHKEGRVRTCQLEPKALQTVEDWVSVRRTMWEQKLDRFGDYLAGQSGGEKQ